MTWLSRAMDIESKIQAIPIHEISYGALDEAHLRKNKIHHLIDDSTASLDQLSRTRISDEFLAYGPIAPLLEDESVTEILILSKTDICFEKQGKLQRLEDRFLSDMTFQNFVEKICQEAKTHFNLENPFSNGKLGDFRIHIVASEITQSSIQISFRRHPKNPWTFESLIKNGWAQESVAYKMKEILNSKKSFLVVGATGSGKTSLLNACLQALPEFERCVLIEDTSELTTPNHVSSKLITRFDAQSILRPIDQSELVRQSLRMRPDRLVMGEIRGHEAKDLLMALSTGHEGSFATLHASNARQALLRLEMLIQMGAPNWSLTAIRNLIALSLKYVVVVEKKPEGTRGLQGIYELSSVEESGILLDRLL